MAILGSYRVLGELGKGAVADVYLASASGPAGGGELVVLKRLRNLKPEQIAPFVDQVRLARRLHHPNIVQTTGIGQDKGATFIVLEYLDGPTLSDLRRLDIPHVPWATEIDIACNVLDGLHYAHELRAVDGKPLQLVHRGLSPEKVLVTERGDTKILDFGTASALDALGETQASGRDKLRSMAPEQLRGHGADRRADVYAAGLMLCEGLIGRSLWGDLGSVEIAARLARGEVPSVHDHASALPKNLRDICARATDARPERRYPSALEFRTALLAYAQENNLLVPRAQVAAYVEGMFAEGRERIETMVQAAAPGRGGQAPLMVPELVLSSLDDPGGAAEAAPRRTGGAAAPSGSERETPAIAMAPPAAAPSRRLPAVVMLLSALVPITIFVVARRNFGFPHVRDQPAPARAPTPVPAPAEPAEQPAPTPAPTAEPAAALPPGPAPTAEPAAAPAPTPAPAVESQLVVAEPAAAATTEANRAAHPAPALAPGHAKPPVIKPPRKPARALGASNAAAPAPPDAEGPRVEQPRLSNGRALDLDSPYPSTAPTPPPPAKTNHNIDRANPFGGPP
jgi:serine/threonine-protein kinase